MDSLELNIKLKEEISILEDMYKGLRTEFRSLCYLPSMVHGNVKLINLMCYEQIKAQKGEKSSQMKFESVEEFANFLGALTDITIKYLEDKYNI